MKIYMAGALFSTSECDFNDNLAALLRVHGHEIFLPQENEQGDDPTAIFKSDVGGINWADMVLGNLDGPDPDSGTCWELGYGYAKDKLIMVYRTDFRIHKGFDPINLMMTESANVVIIEAKLAPMLLAERIDREIREHWPRMQADQFGGFDRTPRYRHEDK